MKYLLVLAILSVLCLANTCAKFPSGPDRAYSFWVKNNSSDSISYLIGKLYPDTTIPDDQTSIVTLKPGAKSPNDSQKDWNYVFADLPADTLSIFFFSRDTLEKYNFQEVRNSYKILERKDISFADLETHGNTVEYP